MKRTKRVSVSKDREKSKRSRFGQHKRSVYIICAVLVLLTGVLSVNSVMLYNQDQAYQEQEKELEMQIEKETERSTEIEAYQEYVQTDDYIKTIAEEKLGLVDPNEIIFRSVE